MGPHTFPNLSFLLPFYTWGCFCAPAGRAITTPLLAPTQLCMDSSIELEFRDIVTEGLKEIVLSDLIAPTFHRVGQAEGSELERPQFPVYCRMATGGGGHLTNPGLPILY